jgi:hypothetical protein
MFKSWQPWPGDPAQFFMLALRETILCLFHTNLDTEPKLSDRGAFRGLVLSLVIQGWCWWYRKYAPGDTVLEGLEAEAREAKKGLWADPQPVPPWEWRKRSR